MNKTENIKTENEKFIIENYAELGGKRCSEILDLSKSTVYRVAINNGLKIKKERQNNSVSDINHKVPSTKFITEIDNNSAYILGLLWGDGYLSKYENSISLECVSEDMIYFKNNLNKCGEWNYYERQRGNKKIITRAHTTNKTLRNYLADNDYLNKSQVSPNKIIATLPNYLIRYFLLGMIDGDGCFYFNQKHGLRQFTLTGTLNQDWGSFEEIFKSLDIEYKINRKPNNKTGYSQIRILNRINIKKLGDFIYPTIDTDKIGLPRKYAKYLSIIQQ